MKVSIQLGPQETIANSSSRNTDIRTKSGIEDRDGHLANREKSSRRKQMIRISKREESGRE